jgi:hypothetical protein
VILDERDELAACTTRAVCPRRPVAGCGRSPEPDDLPVRDEGVVATRCGREIDDDDLQAVERCLDDEVFEAAARAIVTIADNYDDGENWSGRQLLR